MGALEDQIMAEITLGKQGSLMAEGRQRPEWYRKLARLGPNLGPALQTGSDLLDAILSGIGPLDALSGGGSSLAHVPQTYRNLALQRQGGALSPTAFAAKLMEEPNFARFKQLVERAVGKKHGSEFSTYRGFGLNDPMAKAALTGELPPATAVSTSRDVAEDFLGDVIRAGLPGITAEMKATPESVISLLPTRGTPYGSEAELIIDPRWIKSLRTQKLGIKSGMPVSDPRDLIQTAINEALMRIAPRRPIPGSGAAALAESAPQPGIVETLKKALANASQRPVGY